MSYHPNLFSSDGEIALKYLKSRGVNEDTIREFQLGWCPLDDPRNPLRGRITVPLYESDGSLTHYAGRIPTIKENGKVSSLYDGEILIDPQKNFIGRPVWWNSPFMKSCYLYGLNENFNHIMQKQYVVVVEGEFDLYACWQVGIKNVVAILGSAFTDRHKSYIRMMCSHMFLLLDGDKTGRTSADKIIAANKIKDFYIDKVDLPDGYDPFDYISQGGGESLQEAFEKLIAHHNENDVSL